MQKNYDVVIVGGGPAGLSAALALGRGRKRTLLCDSGPPRNAAAVHMHNFVTRDGTPPAEFRRIGRQQLETYPNVEVHEERVEEIGGERGHFEVRLASGIVRARRILLCTGMVDELPELDGYRALWGSAIFQCPYCHAWEIQDRRFAYLASKPEMLSFGLFLRGWTSDVVVLTDARFDVPPELRAALAPAGVGVDERRIVRLVANGERLERIEFADGAPLARDVMFAHPPQRQVDLVRALGVELDAAGFVRVDELHRETSVPGIHAGGDLVSPAQGAIIAAASGSFAAARLNHALTIELASSGALP
ncbi:MAG TPA: NAD(P)/FAD-dependent oxidoreductase [Thermoanaerobaculia bacterium]